MRMKGRWICSKVMACGPLGVRAGWSGLKPNGFGGLVTRFGVVAIFLAFLPHLSTAN
jgi:hypothetical protein